MGWRTDQAGGRRRAKRVCCMKASWAEWGQPSHQLLGLLTRHLLCHPLRLRLRCRRRLRQPRRIRRLHGRLHGRDATVTTRAHHAVRTTRATCGCCVMRAHYATRATLATRACCTARGCACSARGSGSGRGSLGARGASGARIGAPIGHAPQRRPSMRAHRFVPRVVAAAAATATRVCQRVSSCRLRLRLRRRRRLRCRRRFRSLRCRSFLIHSSDYGSGLAQCHLVDPLRNLACSFPAGRLERIGLVYIGALAHPQNSDGIGADELQRRLLLLDHELRETFDTADHR